MTGEGEAVDEVTWTCETCNWPIGAGRGYIHIDPIEASRREREIAEWERRNLEGRTFILASELDEMPADIPWRAQHSACDPQPNGPMYWWDVERIQTLGGVLEWALHIQSKSWASATDWAAVAEGALRRSRGLGRAS